MPLTVAALEAEVLSRVGGKWAQAQLSPLTTGSNPDLRSPVRKGLRYVNVAPADPVTPADADLARVPAAAAEAYMDAVTLEALYAVQGRFLNGFDQKVDAQSQSLHQVMTDLAAMIADYQSRVPKLNLGGTSVGQLAAGSHGIPGELVRRGPYGYPSDLAGWCY